MVLGKCHNPFLGYAETTRFMTANENWRGMRDQQPPENLALSASADYVEGQYRQWQRDPASLSDEWRLFFAGFDLAYSPNGEVAS